MMYAPTLTHLQVDPYLKEPKNRHLFEQLEGLIQAREDSIFHIRQSEEEVINIIFIIIRQSKEEVINLPYKVVGRRGILSSI